MQPSAALQALVQHLIDYAGIFPPAALPLDASIRNYARYVRGPDRWMLGRFICPAARLQELLPFVGELFGEDQPLTISALGCGGAMDVFEENLDADLDAIAAFRSAAGDSPVVDAFETRAADPTIETAGHAPELLAQRCTAAGLRPFLEIGLAGDWPSGLPRIAAALAEHGVGFKVRSGGVEARAFPATDQVAAAIVACRDAGTAMKFTAGLHHPIRHYNDSVKTKMHGFLNVFIAAALAKAHGFDEKQVREVLEVEDACCFRFRDWGLSFGDQAVPTEQLAAIRRDFATSFGSCSFDEPRDDLCKLGLLPAADQATED